MTPAPPPLGGLGPHCLSQRWALHRGSIWGLWGWVGLATGFALLAGSTAWASGLEEAQGRQALGLRTTPNLCPLCSSNPQTVLAPHPLGPFPGRNSGHGPLHCLTPPCMFSLTGHNTPTPTLAPGNPEPTLDPNPGQQWVPPLSWPPGMLRVMGVTVLGVLGVLGMLGTLVRCTGSSTMALVMFQHSKARAGVGRRKCSTWVGRGRGGLLVGTLGRHRHEGGSWMCLAAAANSANWGTGTDNPNPSPSTLVVVGPGGDTCVQVCSCA